MKRAWFLTLCAAACSGKSEAPAIDAAPRIDAGSPFVDAAPVVDAPIVIDARIVDARIAIDANPLTIECQDLRQRWLAIVSRLGTTCGVPGDCLPLGKNGNSTCDAYPMLASRCDGDPVAKTAYTAAAAELDPITAEFQTKCVRKELCPAQDLGCFPRCSDSADVNCVHNACVSFTPVCMSLGDAGPP